MKLIELLSYLPNNKNFNISLYDFEDNKIDYGFTQSSIEEFSLESYDRYLVVGFDINWEFKQIQVTIMEEIK
jgi:hypothetical protein